MKKEIAHKPEKKVVFMPGVQPKYFINKAAADELQEVVRKLRRGESVGVAWAHITPTGKGRTGWNTPNGMGNDLYAAVGKLAHLMIAGQGDGGS